MGDIENYYLSFFTGLEQPEIDINKIKEEINESRTYKTESNSL